MTTPTEFNSENTGTFRVQPLSDRVDTRQLEEQTPSYAGEPITSNNPPWWLGLRGPALFYGDDLGNVQRVDIESFITHPGPDASDVLHRQRLLLRALLQHTLAMLNGEDVS